MFLKGQLLIAAPSLVDPNFNRTVVLIVQHNAEGALGLILNRPTTAKIQQVWRQVSETPTQCEAHLYVGGPCKGPLMAIHSEPDCSDLQVLTGVYFSAEPAMLEQLVTKNPEQVRFFIGCAGWGKGQLEHELQAEAWVTLPTTAAQIFAARGPQIWEQATRDAAGRQLLSALGIKHVPNDPSLN